MPPSALIVPTSTVRLLASLLGSLPVGPCTGSDRQVSNLYIEKQIATSLRSSQRRTLAIASSTAGAVGRNGVRFTTPPSLVAFEDLEIS